MQKNIPAVSIVIPMYNAEKYIGECLNSILAQTFQDFEVIVVDDCSTDNSCAIVENYLSTFNRGGVDDRLKLIRSKINSGASGVPRYEGLLFARGEYISFIDSEDFITKTALEELYTIAKKFDADVVHCERFFQFKDGEKKFTLESYQTGELVKEPTLITENLAERVKELYDKKFLWNLWTKLIRRDFLIANNLKMINSIAADAIFTCLLVCSKNKYVRVPNIVNFYRVVDDSISHKKRNVAQKLHAWTNSLIEGFRCLDKFLSEQEFFQQRPDAKNLALETWVRECCDYFLEPYAQIPAFQLDEQLRKEFKGNALMAFIFSRMNTFHVQLIRQSQIIQQQQAKINELQRRLENSL